MKTYTVHYYRANFPRPLRLTVQALDHYDAVQMAPAHAMRTKAFLGRV